MFSTRPSLCLSFPPAKSGWRESMRRKARRHSETGPNRRWRKRSAAGPSRLWSRQRIGMAGRSPIFTQRAAGSIWSSSPKAGRGTTGSIHGISGWPMLKQRRDRQVWVSGPTRIPFRRGASGGGIGRRRCRVRLLNDEVIRWGVLAFNYPSTLFA